MLNNESVTSVGESILISGSLKGDEDLTIYGRVEGEIQLSKTVNIAESGIVRAEISARHVVLSGIVIGNIRATDSVHVLRTGRLVGDIFAPRIVVMAGARVRGEVDMGDMAAPREMPARRSSFSSNSPNLPSRASAPTSTGQRISGSIGKIPNPASARSAASAAPSRPAPSAPSRPAPPTSGKLLKRKVVVKRPN